MYFFPGSGYYPYEISDHAELNGAARCMLVDLEDAPGWERQLSFFVSEDVKHVLAFECHRFRKNQPDLHRNHVQLNHHRVTPRRPPDRDYLN